MSSSGSEQIVICTMTYASYASGCFSMWVSVHVRVGNEWECV